MKYTSRQIASFAEIRECLTTKHKSLYATTSFSSGDIIHRFTSKKILLEPNYLSVQLDDNKHIMLEPEFLQYINHSCNPNVFFDTKDMLVVSLKDINIGEEMTFFYPSTEWSMTQPFHCHCQDQECLGFIRGAAHLNLNIINKYKLSDYIKQKIKKSTSTEENTKLLKK